MSPSEVEITVLKTIYFQAGNRIIASEDTQGVITSRN